MLKGIDPNKIQDTESAVNKALLSIKDIYIYPLSRNFKQELSLTPHHSLLSEDHPC